MSSDKADQSKPFVLSTTLGEFLRGTSNFFLSIALFFSFMEYFEMKVDSNAVVFSMLLHAVVINVLLEINSRIVFAFVGFLTFLSVVGQLIIAFVSLFSGTLQRGAGTSQASYIIVIACLFMFISVILIVQLFCSAALFKLSGIMSTEEPPKKTKKKSTKSKKSKKSHKKTVNSLESAPTDSTQSTTFSEDETTR